MSRILLACEESQALTIRFREIGHEAYSCDLEPCSGGHPEWHLQQDVIPLLKEDWNLVLAFPPCTHLASSGAAWFEQKRKDGRQQQGIDFFLQFTELKCNLVVIENPVGIMSTHYRKPTQIIQPYEYGDEYRKRTCLWIKGLPDLTPTKIVGQGELIKYASGKVMPKWYAETFGLPPKERSKIRSKTFPGIANAMVDQWSMFL